MMALLDGHGVHHKPKDTTMKTTIFVKCTRESVDFDTDELPTVSTEFAWDYGLKQWINDGAAKVRDKYDSDAEYEAARVDGANDRIARLRSGDVPGTRAPADPAKKKAQLVEFMRRLPAEELAELIKSVAA
jgi:hypothetical protein